MKTKIKKFIKLHDRANKFFNSKSYQWNKPTTKKGKEMDARGLVLRKELEELHKDILTDIDTEVKRLLHLKRMIGLWSFRDAEGIEMSFVEDTLHMDNGLKWNVGLPR